MPKTKDGGWTLDDGPLEITKQELDKAKESTTRAGQTIKSPDS